MKPKSILNLATFLILLFVLNSCSSNEGDAKEVKMSPQEQKALETVQNRIKTKRKLRNHTLGNYEFAYGKIPVEYSDHFPNYNREISNILFNGRKTEEEKYKKLNKYQKVFLDNVENVKKNSSQKEFLFVMGILNYDDGINLDHSKFIAVFDRESGDSQTWYNVTDEIYKSTLYTEAAKAGKFAEAVLGKGLDTDSLANTISDPVVKFILTPIEDSNQ